MNDEQSARLFQAAKAALVTRRPPERHPLTDAGGSAGAHIVRENLKMMASRPPTPKPPPEAGQ